MTLKSSNEPDSLEYSPQLVRIRVPFRFGKAHVFWTRACVGPRDVMGIGFALSVHRSRHGWAMHAMWQEMSRLPCRCPSANSVAKGREMVVHANIFMSSSSMNMLLYVPQKLWSHSCSFLAYEICQP